jgi:hypothetical protein
MKSQTDREDIIEGLNEFQSFITQLKSILINTRHKDRLLRENIEELINNCSQNQNSYRSKKEESLNLR